MQLDQRAREAQASDLWTMKTVLAYFGGERPLHASTLYRGIAAGRYPAPIKPSPNIARWRRSECEVAMQRIVEERDRDE